MKGSGHERAGMGRGHGYGDMAGDHAARGML